MYVLKCARQCSPKYRSRVSPVYASQCTPKKIAGVARQCTLVNVRRKKIAGVARQCKIYASLFLSSSGPHAMVQEAFLTTKDILIVRRFCARQVEIYN